MQAGEYYVGDLCYVMTDEEWQECCELFFADRNGREINDGEFTLKDGRRFASYSTKHGDGSYKDQHGNRYSVDAGLIGCISVYDIRDQSYSIEKLMQLGAIVDFEAPFEVSNDQGLLKFGPVEIETAGGYDWDEDEDEELEI